MVVIGERLINVQPRCSERLLLTGGVDGVAGKQFCSETMYHQCDNGRCVVLQWVCDGEDDCGDNSDELLCGAHVTFIIFFFHLLVYIENIRTGVGWWLPLWPNPTCPLKGRDS